MTALTFSAWLRPKAKEPELMASGCQTRKKKQVSCLSLGRVATPTAREGGQRTADVAGDDFVDERKAVAFVCAEGQEGFRLRRVGGWHAIFINGRLRRELFSFAEKLLHAAHGHDAGGPVDDDRVANGAGGRGAPWM